MDFFSKVFSSGIPQFSTTTTIPPSGHPRGLEPDSKGAGEPTGYQHTQDAMLDGSDPSPYTSTASLDQFKVQLRSTLDTFVALDNDGLVELSRDDEYLEILKQLVGPLALNKQSTDALVTHLEGLPSVEPEPQQLPGSTELEPQHRFTIHFMTDVPLPQQESLLDIVNRNIAKEVKESIGQQVFKIEKSSPCSLVFSTNSPKLARNLQPQQSSPKGITLSTPPNIFRGTQLENHGWWCRAAGEELYILHFLYMPTTYLKAGTLTYLEAAIRKRCFDGAPVPLGAMRWRFVTPKDATTLGPADRHRYYEAWEAWIQVGRGGTPFENDRLGKKKFEMRVPNHNNWETRVDVKVLVYHD